MGVVWPVALMKRSRELSRKGDEGTGEKPKEETAVPRTTLAAPLRDRRAKALMPRRKDKTSKMAEHSSKTFTMEESEIAALNVSFLLHSSDRVRRERE